MIVNPKKLLWPTDFSELSLKGGRYARGLREHFNAELHIIHVTVPVMTPDYAAMLPASLPASTTDAETIDACRKSVLEIVTRHFDGQAGIVTDVFPGTPWSAICDYAQRELIELIVVATHGRTGLKHALIGSTAERIVRHAPCPVLTVKIAETDFVSE